MKEHTNNSFSSRLKTMLGVDFRRMFTSSLFYIMLLISFVMPILILVMTTMMDGTVSVDPQTGVETVIEGFKNVWQIFGSTSSAEASMDITSMCNINMMYFVVAVFVCIFISSDFRSGYCKNLFTARSKKDDYVVSKTISCFVAGAFMLVAFFVGAMMGGLLSGLSFDLDGITSLNILFSLISKVALVLLFVAIFVLASTISKQRLWLSILLSLGIGMLFFMTVTVVAPLDATIINVVLAAIGSVIFAAGLGFASKYVLQKYSIL